MSDISADADARAIAALIRGMFDSFAEGRVGGIEAALAGTAPSGMSSPLR